MTTTRPSQPAGDLLREWRRHRKLIQMDLSIEAGISTRHLSFLETGRTAPSRHVVLRLGETLGLPLRERNRLLLAAGYAPGYQETSLGAPAMSAVRDMVRQVLAAHEPFPGFVVDGHWHRVEANQPALLFTVGVSPELLKEPVNVLRLCLHPEGLAPLTVNLGEWRAHLLARLRQQIAATADSELTGLYDELKDYPCDQGRARRRTSGPGRDRHTPPAHVRGRGTDLLQHGEARSARRLASPSPSWPSNRSFPPTRGPRRSCTPQPGRRPTGRQLADQEIHRWQEACPATCPGGCARAVSEESASGIDVPHARPCGRSRGQAPCGATSREIIQQRPEQGR